MTKCARMPRTNRYVPIGVPQHIIHRGNNKQSCFQDSRDRLVYLGLLQMYANKHHVSIHAWVLMDNHVHILCTPNTSNSLSKLIQDIGRRYVVYFNRKHTRSGSLWEGRYKSIPIEDEQYLLEVYRYIELNPVRAGLVTSPEEYVWSSYRTNALGKTSTLVTPHSQLIELDKDECFRQKIYRDYVDERK